MLYNGLITWAALLVIGCHCQPSDGPECAEGTDLDKYCMPDNSTGPVCNGHGDCICGVCRCHTIRQGSIRKFSGKFCQCNDFSCNYFYGALCGGTERGRCNCGLCECTSGYTGVACDCPISTESCMTSNEKICNGEGVCECGVCRCFQGSIYKGPTCEECPACPGKCTENKQCALCVGFGTGYYSAEECEEKCSHVHVVDQVTATNDENGERLCQFYDEEDDCRFFFTYRYTEIYHHVVVKVQSRKVCPYDQTTPGGTGTGFNPSAAATVLGVTVCVFLHRI